MPKHGLIPAVPMQEKQLCERTFRSSGNEMKFRLFRHKSEFQGPIVASSKTPRVLSDARRFHRQVSR